MFVLSAWAQARFGPMKRHHGPTGVPADRLMKAGRHRASTLARFDHAGRVTGLLAEGQVTDVGAPPDDAETLVEPERFKALPLSAGPSETSDDSWDGPANEKNLDNDDGEDEYRQAYAWQDDSADADTKSAYGFIHHFVDSSGKVGAASTKACSSGIGILNGGRGVDVKSAAWYDDREGIYKHLVGHLKAAGVADDDLPELDDMTTVEANDFSYSQAADDHFAALHEGKAVTHTHTHSTYGSQGGDKTHSHQHSHNGDANHNHHRTAATATVTPITGPEHLAAKMAELRERQAQTPEIERIPVTIVASAGDAEGITVDMAVRWDDEAWDPYRFDPSTRTLGAKGAFVSTLPEASEAFAMVAAGADLPQIVDNPGSGWDSYLCIEGVRTDEGYFSRELMPEACLFPDLPVSMRLQIKDEGGHYGAVTCGRIDTMERVAYPEGDGLNAIAASGVFGTDEHGQTGQLLVEEQTQRFVSVDLRDMESEIVEIAVSVSVGGYDYDCDDEDDAITDWWLRVTSCVIGGATIVAMPALQQAVIVLAGVDLPTAPLALERSPATAITVTASAGSPELLAAPPAEWFEDPGFHVGDPRLVRQPDGHRACPLTITDDGRVYGHAAYWGAEHVGVRAPNGRGVKPPHSPTYAYFMTGAVTTAEGDEIAVGPITMGCGHASLSLPYKPALAHYDGGYGAVQVANVRMGEDDFGIWVAGSLCPQQSEANPQGPTDEQVRLFKTMGLSGDWRSVAGSRKPHLIACLAVPVPGFPIARTESLVASAAITEAIANGQLVDHRDNADGEPIALVAAGRVRAMSTDERLDQLSTAVEILLEERRDRERATILGALGRL